MPRMKKDSDVTPEVAKRGIYIDFEGPGKKKDGSLQMPCFLGVLVAKTFSQDFFEPEFKTVLKGRNPAPRPPATREITTLDSCMEELIERCRDEDRKMFAFSIAEEDLLEAFCSRDLVRRIESAKLLINAKINPLKRWRNKLHGGKRPHPEKLKSYFDLINYKLPQELIDEPVKPAKIIHAIRAAVGKTNYWSKLKDKTKNDWVRLLLYNYHDCKGLQRLTIKAANGLAAKPK